MLATTYTIGFNLAVVCALARVAGIMLGAARSLSQRRRFSVIRFGPVEAVTLLEPLVLAGVAVLLLVTRKGSDSVSAAQAGAALAGGVVALAGFAVVVWTLLSWRQLFVGHGVLENQRLITAGAYGLVRHPVYLGALMIWCGLSLCFLSPVAAAVTAAYVLPAYLLYIRSEEAMLCGVFTEEYRSYQRQVPMLLPLPRLRGVS
jgi:protein-S-isoprenylcysteine O-methyltransferase Ste14